ncbi:cytochrome P450 6B5-like [Battus philenor]|uniref:cytochrome P450 6B5-like n=1 Tax=Battus philenor TaxID=42288 RepID=UPI0035CFBE7F
MFLTILIAFSAFILIYYLLGVYNEIYWKRRGVKFYKKNRVFGPMWEFLTTDRAFFIILNDIYKKYPNEPAVGLGTIITPGLYIKDPVNIEHILQMDFKAFNHKGIEIHEDDKLADNMLFMSGNRWKVVRQNMTPIFTSAKLKNMFYIMDRSARDFVDLLNNNPDKLKHDAFKIMCTFSCAALGAAVFGIGTSSIFQSPFLKMAFKALQPTKSRNIKFMITSLNTKLYKCLGLKIFKEHEEFFIPAIKQLILQREQENVRRHDFGDICIDLKRKGLLKDHDSGLQLEPTDELLAAQAFFYYVAGVEPVGVAMFSALLELGRNPEILRRVHDEIDRSFENNNNKMSYDTIMQMEYLDMVYNESLRMYPPIGFFVRECVRNSVLPVGNIKVDKGTKIFAPIYEIHHDPKYFPDPEVFNPERFSRENRSSIPHYTFLPFGNGNRICLGIRYAGLQLKTGLVHLLRNFTVKTIVREGGIKFNKQNVQVRPGNLEIEFTPRSITM